MKRLFFLALLVAQLVPTSEPAFAKDDEGDGSRPLLGLSRSGFYVDFGGVTGIATGAVDALGLAGAGSVDRANGLNARLGARSGAHFASELQVEYLPSFDVRAFGVEVAEYSALALTGNLKLITSRGRIQPYLTVGGGGFFGDLTSNVSTPNVSGSGFAVRGGGGCDVYLSEHVAFVLDATYVYPTGEVTGLDYMSVGWGLAFRF